MHSQPDASLSGAVRRRSTRALRWRLSRFRAELALRLAPDSLPPQIAAARVPVDAEVVAYFPDGPDRSTSSTSGSPCSRR